jgi:DNA polymerase zeta
MTSIPPEDTFFTLRIVNIDYYMTKPKPEFDVVYSSFSGSAIQQVPVVRIFGSTPAGQKTCLHMHKVYCLFFIFSDSNLGISLFLSTLSGRATLRN